MQGLTAPKGEGEEAEDDEGADDVWIGDLPQVYCSCFLVMASFELKSEFVGVETSSNAICHTHTHVGCLYLLVVVVVLAGCGRNAGL
jgi:hypothetical protein